MITRSWDAILSEVTALAGVRGALVISAEDGLVVHETALDGLPTSEVAALGTALARRAERTVATFTNEPIRLLTLVGASGSVVAARGRDQLWLVAVTDAEAEFGRLRLLLGDVASELA